MVDLADSIALIEPVVLNVSVESAVMLESCGLVECAESMKNVEFSDGAHLADSVEWVTLVVLPNLCRND